MALAEMSTRGERGAPPRAPAVASALLLAAAAALATHVGVDAARRPLDARAVARAAAERTLERGIDDPALRDALIELRTALARRPLDAALRASYAGLLLAACREADDRSAAAFHAARAADLAPVTVHVVQLAALVLGRSGEIERALALAQRMFEFDARAAARLLAQFVPLVPPEQLGARVPDDPDAWLAWSWMLREQQGDDAADRWLERLHERWPEHLPAWRLLAERAVRRDDWDTLAALVPPERNLPDDVAAATLHVCRARLRIARGDGVAARQEIELARRLGAASTEVEILAGDAYLALRDVVRARRIWTHALHALPAAAQAPREQLLVLLARLEERHGEPVAALRWWRELLREQPAHPEALARSRAIESGS